MDDKNKREQLAAILASGKLNDPEIRERAERIATSLEDDDNRNLAFFELARAYAAAAEWIPAERTARNMPSCYEKADAMLEIASRMASSQFAQQLTLILRDARILMVNGGWGKEWQRAELLNKLGRILTSSGLLEARRQVWELAITIARAGEASGDVQDSVDSSSVLGETAYEMALAGDAESAREIAQTIRNPGKREGALSRLSRITRA